MEESLVQNDSSPAPLAVNIGRQCRPLASFRTCYPINRHGVVCRLACGRFPSFESELEEIHASHLCLCVSVSLLRVKVSGDLP